MSDTIEDFISIAEQCLRDNELSTLWDLLFNDSAWGENICVVGAGEKFKLVGRPVASIRRDLIQASHRLGTSLGHVLVVSIAALAHRHQDFETLPDRHVCSLAGLQIAFRTREPGSLGKLQQLASRILRKHEVLLMAYREGVTLFLNSALKIRCFHRGKSKWYLTVIVNALLEIQDKVYVNDLLAESNYVDEEKLAGLIRVLNRSLCRHGFSQTQRISFLASGLLALQKVSDRREYNQTRCRLFLLDYWLDLESQSIHTLKDSIRGNRIFIDVNALWLSDLLSLNESTEPALLQANPNKVFVLASRILEFWRDRSKEHSLTATLVEEEVSSGQQIAALRASTELAWDAVENDGLKLFAYIEGISRRFSLLRRTKDAIKAGEIASEEIQKSFTDLPNGELLAKAISPNTLLLGLYDIPNGLPILTSIYKGPNGAPALDMVKGEDVYRHENFPDHGARQRLEVKRVMDELNGSNLPGVVWLRAGLKLKIAVARIQKLAACRFSNAVDYLLELMPSGQRPDVIVVPRGICAFAFPEILGRQPIMEQVNSIRFLPYFATPNFDPPTKHRQPNVDIGIVLSFKNVDEAQFVERYAKNKFAEMHSSIRFYPDADAATFLRAADECRHLICISHGSFKEIAVELSDGIFPQSNHLKYLLNTACESILFCSCHSGHWIDMPSEIFQQKFTFGPLGKAVSLDIALQSNKAIAGFVLPVNAVAAINVISRTLSHLVESNFRNSLAEAVNSMKCSHRLRDLWSIEDEREVDEQLHRASGLELLELLTALSLRVIQRPDQIES